MSGIHYISNRTSTHLPSFAPLSCGSGSSPCSHHLLTILCRSCGSALCSVLKVKYISSTFIGPVFHKITPMGIIFTLYTLIYQQYGFNCHVLPTECLLSMKNYATRQFVKFSHRVTVLILLTTVTQCYPSLICPPKLAVLNPTFIVKSLVRIPFICLLLG